MASLALSNEAIVVDPLIKLIGENRAMKLSSLVKAGLITPAVSDVITAKYVKPEAVALEKGDSDGFDLLYQVLTTNKPVALEEESGVQSLELANQSALKTNVMEKVVSEKRKAAGYKD